MRILQVLDYAPEFGGGLADQLLALGESLHDRGDGMLLALPARPPWADAFEPHTRVLRIPSIRRPVASLFPEALRRIRENEPFDLVHLHFSFALALSLSLWPRRVRVPVVVHWHNPPRALMPRAQRAGGSGSEVGGGGLRSVSGLADAVAKFADHGITRHVAVSGAIRDLIVGARWTTADRIVVVPNAVRTRPAKVQAGATRARRQGGPCRIVCVANFRPQKDHATLVRAFALLAPGVPEARLVLIGSGPGRRSIEALAAGLGIADRVEFAGSVPNDALDYTAYDVFALASRYEGNPLSVLEAMASGLPVVATGVDGTAEVVRDGVDGILVPPAAPRALADALLRLANDPGERARLGEAGRRKAESAYGMDRWVADLIGLYEEILGRA